MTITEAELIEGCIKQDRNMQEQLYKKYAASMYAVAYRYAKMQQEAEDITQEAFVKVFKNIENFRKDSSLPYWIKRIVINTALNHQRSKMYLFPMMDVNELKSQQITENVLDNFSYEELLKMIKELPDGCRTIFNLYAIEGYKHQEIAMLLDINEGTSKSQYFRAKALMKDKIEERNKIKYGQIGEK